jgi:hypothetical protein
MKMLKTGGHLIVLTAANNLFGHGFISLVLNFFIASFA